MIKTFMFCNFCDNNITEQIEEMERKVDVYIVINGRLHYCDEDCQSQMQERCLKETNHNNSVKDLTGGECLDCGVVHNVD